MTPSWSGTIRRGATRWLANTTCLSKHAIVLRALPSADAADRRVLVVPVGVHHVTDELADVHPAVAVERDHGRADDVRGGGDKLQPVPGGQPKPACSCSGLRGR